MHMMDGDTLYHVILGRPWLNAHRVVASTYHQCVKAIWRGRLVTIEFTRMSFDRVELHYAEATLYQEFEPKGENRVLPFHATILEQEENGDGEVIESERPFKIKRITKPNGKVIYEF
nr:hypothetical protein CFP56_13674 [Quercus suber]